MNTKLQPLDKELLHQRDAYWYAAASLNLPDHLPPGVHADPPAAAVKERDNCAQEGS